MNERKQLPSFASEAEEAKWWYDNREEHDAAFAAAIRDGRARRSTLEERLAAARAIQLDAEDEARAIRLAAAQGVEYRAFVKELVHNALLRSDVAA
jgi:hypothetical protein